MDGMVAVGLACSGLLLVLPAVALFLALSARSRTQALERRIEGLETELFELKRVARSPAPSSAIRALPVPVPVASKSAPAPEIAPPVTETAEITDLTYYDTPGGHTQSLADKGRFYAHVIAVDAQGDANAFTFGPVYFDGATPASSLNCDEFGPGQP